MLGSSEEARFAALNGIVAGDLSSAGDRLEGLLELGRRSLGMARGLLLGLDAGALPEILMATAPEGGIPAWLEPALKDLSPGATCYCGVAGLIQRLPAVGGKRRFLCFAEPLYPAAEPEESDRHFLELLAQWMAVELERRQQSESLQDLSEWQRVILQSANSSIIATTTDGVIVSFNRAAEKMLGYLAEEVVGKQTPALVHDPAEVLARAPELSRELGVPVEPGFDVFVAKTRLGIAEEREWTYVRKDGSRFPVLLSVTAMRNPNGEIRGYLGIALDLTLRKRFEEASAQARANELSRALIRSLAEGVIGVAVDKQHTILFLNPEAERLFGVSEAEAIGRPLDAVVQSVAQIAEAEPAVCRSFSRLLRGEPARETVETTVRAQASGRIFPVDCIISLAHEVGGQQLAVISFHDISERRQAEQRLRLSDKVFEYSAEAIMVTDPAGIILNVNPAFTWLTGYRPDEVIGRTPRVLASGRHDKLFYETLWGALLADGHWSGEIWDRRKDGSLYPKWIIINAIRESGRTTHYVALFYDISERKENEERINFLAHHDHLTGLPNRLMFKERMGQALVRADRAGSRLALIFLDLDRFKNINDSLGHHIGDQLLIEVSRRLTASVRLSDTVARLGGDEFVVVVENIDSQNDAAQVAIKVHATLGQPFVIEGKTLHTPPSMGISLYPDDGRDVETLMKQADTAMYQVKAAGRNNWTFYTSRMNDEVQERIALESDLRLALERGEFELHYQPQWDLAVGRLFGWEALLRWRHPERGMISPERFIPIAEETGLILPVGDWVLATALNELRRWDDAGLERCCIAVNLSGRQFRQHLLGERIEALLAAAGLTPERLELEITESVLMEDADAASAILGRLKRHGVRIAIDDFGTGYSSLAYLKSFPINKLKIDRSFVRDIASDPNDAAIVSAIISMAHSMGLGTIAEGVESEEQKNFLLSRGCSEIQGYLLGKPMSATAAMAMLAEQSEGLVPEGGSRPVVPPGGIEPPIRP